MRPHLLFFAALQLAHPAIAEDAAPDSLDEVERAIETGEIPGVVVKFDSPEEEVRYLVNDYKAAHLNPFNHNPRFIRRRARADPETYFPLLREGWEEVSDRAEAEAHLAWLLDIYRESHAAELRELFLPMLRGEVSRSFEPCEDCVEEELFLPYLAMDLMRRMPSLARPEDARLIASLRGGVQRVPSG